jgi:hypothetical protein
MNSNYIPVALKFFLAFAITASILPLCTYFSDEWKQVIDRYFRADSPASGFRVSLVLFWALCSATNDCDRRRVIDLLFLVLLITAFFSGMEWLIDYEYKGMQGASTITRLIWGVIAPSLWAIVLFVSGMQRMDSNRNDNQRTN